MLILLVATDARCRLLYFLLFYGCQVQTFFLLTSFSAASLSATSLGSRRNASPAWSPSSSSSRQCRAPSRLATTSPSTRVPASAFLATTRTTCKEISSSCFDFSSAATGQVHHWTGVTPRWWQWGRRTSRLMPSSSLALKIPMAANLGPQPMACMISLSSYSKIQTDQLFPHKRLPASDLENSCNATLLLLDGSQMVALGQQTIGDQLPCLLMQ